jgi:hypothetical protein
MVICVFACYIDNSLETFDVAESKTHNLCRSKKPLPTLDKSRSPANSPVRKQFKKGGGIEYKATKGTLFECEFGCGFQGSLSEVSTHERECPKVHADEDMMQEESRAVYVSNKEPVFSRKEAFSLPRFRRSNGADNRKYSEWQLRDQPFAMFTETGEAGAWKERGMSPLQTRKSSGGNHLSPSLAVPAKLW